MKKTLYVFVWACSALLALPAAAQIPGYVPTDGLVGWWPFNGNANDESGNGNDGVVNGATLTEDRFGNAGSAFSFDGVDDFINVLNNDELSLTSDEFSISAWYTTAPSIIAENRNILCKSNGPGAQNKWILMKSEGGGFYPEGVGLLTSPIINAAAFNGFTSVSDPSEYNNWNHILITKINDSINLYLNGEISSVTSITSNISPSVADLRIGGDEINSVDNAKFWSGLIDDIAIYNRALTEQEIQNLYTGTTPAPCAALPSNLQQGLVGYWPFCGNANDESGNGNDGTVNGATLTEDRFGNSDKAYFFAGGPNADADDIQFNNPITGDLDFSLCYWMESLNFSDSRHITLVGDNGNAFEFMSHNDTSIFFRNWNGPQSIPVLDVIFDFDYSIASISNFCIVYNHTD